MITTHAGLLDFTSPMRVIHLKKSSMIPDMAQLPDKNSKRMFSDQDRENIRWLWNGYLREKAKWVLLIFLLVLSQGFVYQQFLRLTEDGLRVIFESGNISELVIVCVTVFGVFGYRGVMSYVVPRLSAWVSADAIKKLRDDLINHLMDLDLNYFERTPPGETILRLSQQVEQMGSFLGQSVVKAGRDFFTIRMSVSILTI